MARPSARDRLLDCAEELFAEHGLQGVSLRGINSAAGLSPAALHYHFGSREALVEALLERRMGALMGRRQQLLDELEAAPGTPTARDVLAALVQPLAEYLAEGGADARRYVRLLARLQADGDMDPTFALARYRGGVDRLDPLLQRALPDQPVGTVRLRMALAIELMLRALADWETLARTGRDEAGVLELDALVGSLLDFLTGGLEAPARHSHPRGDSSPERRKGDPA